ncbi:trypsin-like serine protease [Streptomyces sp. NPDC002553]|uniref:trypsin-like serine protease n=1 Tax=Streptomyces sp. NPDC002553 TaxID=3154417 RepID=UPI00331EAE57
MFVPYYDGSNTEACTVSLIRSDVGLTAAHCFKDHGYDLNKRPVKLRFGSNLADSGGETRIATSVLLGNGFDLALVRFPSVTGVRPVQLVAADQKDLWRNGTVGLAAGWGGTATEHLASHLQAGALKIEDQVYSLAQTISGYNYLMKASPYSGKTAPGDSGGPLVNEHFVNGATVHTLVGVLSQGSKLDASAYTKVGSTLPWITSFLNANSVLPPPTSPTPPVNKPPTASFTWARKPGARNIVAFDGRASFDEGGISAWKWYRGNTLLGTGATPTFSLGASTSQTVTLVVTDNQGATGSVKRILSLPNRPPVIRSVTPAGAVVGTNTPTLSAATGDDDGDTLQFSYRVTGPAVDISSGWVGGSWKVPEHRLDPGTTYQWTVRAKDSAGATASRTSSFTVAMLPTAASVVQTSTGGGYWQADTYGSVHVHGDASFYGSLPGLGVHVTNIIGLARTPTNRGYWLVGRDGGVFAFGDAPFAGSLPGLKIKVSNIVGMAPTRTGKGYWLVGGDGGVFAFGDAGFYGSMGGKPLNAPVTAIAATPGNAGYWLAARDGGVFAFGDASFYGSMGGKPLNAPVVDMDTTPDGKGYWMTAEDGGVFAFGDAGFYGSLAGKPLNGHITSMSATPTGGGYLLSACDGGIFAFGNAAFRGSDPTYQCRGT